MASRRLRQTISPSIDILKSSNLERLLYHASGNNGAAVSRMMRNLEENKYFTVSVTVHGNGILRDCSLPINLFGVVDSSKI